MKSQKISWRENTGWSAGANSIHPHLAIVFGAREAIERPALFNKLSDLFPEVLTVGCSTGGQIEPGGVGESGADALLLQFDNTPLRIACTRIETQKESFEAGKRIADELAHESLRAIFVLSDGLHVNGAQLVKGIAQSAGPNVIVSGGLAGDGADFRRTLVHGKGETEEKRIAAIGFYGDSFRVGSGSAAGWTPFGPKRTITGARDNILYELDGQNALDLYKAYLGEEAKGLPGTALLYPLAIYDPDKPEKSIIRTILSVDEADSSMTFAGDMPLGWRAHLMRGAVQDLAQAAQTAADQAFAPMSALTGEKAAIFVSCIGRKIMMGENVVSEILAAQKALDRNTAMAGFYSYGEISPHGSDGFCELHNQTMTVAVFSEA